MRYRLGLDLGTNSIGWAAVTLDADDQPCGVLDMGVRVFPDGRDPQSQTSNAATRRVARGQRRRRDRYLQRRTDLVQALIACGLMPADKDARKQLAKLDPYTLRATALDQPLQPDELGRAIFHLDQRRGFKSNRKASGDDDSAAKQIGPKIEGLSKSIAESGARTLGEFLARQLKQGQTARFRPGVEFYPDRVMYEAEFAAIREVQESHQALSPDQWNTLHDIIFFQRPLRPVEPGWCRFEHGEKRAAKALPVFQEFRMLLEISNMKLQVGSEDRRLDAGERERALQRLRAGQDINLKKPVKALGLPSGATFNLSRGGRTIVKGDEATARLIEKKERGKKKQALFGKRWLTRSLDERNEIVRFLIKTEDPAEVHRKAMADWGLTDEQAKAVSEVALPSGYGDLSEKAIGKLLSHLEAGLGYSEAVIAAGYPHHSDFRNTEAHARLPYYGAVLERDAVGADPTKDPQVDGEVARYGRFPNPTVHIGLNQLRRVVNRLIAVYGKPEEIVVEVGRDLKANKEDRDRYRKQQREGRERNERYKEQLESAGGDNTPDMRLKLRLWEEQGEPPARRCPYTGKTLSFEMVVSERTQIDHILPFSRTLHDSRANMVVCVAAANQVKGNRAPYEAFGHSPPGYDYEAILARAAKLPGNKRWRFQPDAMEQFEDERDFLDRQLNETRYLSRTARTYLAYLYDEQTEGRVRVRAIPGHMTALLRRGWGLEGILRDSKDGEPSRKQRDDHRHHAIDAFVVANTTQGLLQRFARAAASQYDRINRLDAVAGKASPWAGFDRRQLQPYLDRLVVSYKRDRGTRGTAGRTTGQLHNETAYGFIEAPTGDVPSEVVTRRELATGATGWPKTRKHLESVRDDALRAALLALWDRVKAEGKKPAEFVERAANDGVLLNGQRQRVRRVRVVENLRVIPIKDHAGKPYKGYMPDSNEFVHVWRMRDRSWKLVVVSTFEANQSGFDIEDIERFRPTSSRGPYRGKPDPAAKYLMRLHKDDMGVLGKGQDRRIVHVRQIWATTVVLDDHNEADVDARERRGEMDRSKSSYSAKKLREQGFRKVRVDEIGRVRDPRPPAP